MQILFGFGLAPLLLGQRDVIRLDRQFDRGRVRIEIVGIIRKRRGPFT
jgi:hypothetical protein